MSRRGTALSENRRLPPNPATAPDAPALAPLDGPDGGNEPPAAIPWTIECEVHFRTGSNGRRRLRAGAEPPSAPVAPGTIPRVARLLALAHRFEGLIRDGHVRDLAHIASLAHITRARATQIMNLLSLAPDIQEEILFLPRTTKGRDAIAERNLRSVVLIVEWRHQRRVWQELRR